jgi:hypothetical protein
MLMKALCSGRDFTKSLKQRWAMAVARLCVGLVGFVCYACLVPASELGEYARGFYLGAASGVTAGALVLLLRTQYLLTHPDAQKKARIRETDEREVQITQNSFRLAGLITFFASVAALFVLLPLSMPAFCALLGSIMVYTVSFGAANLWLSRNP